MPTVPLDAIYGANASPAGGGGLPPIGSGPFGTVPIEALYGGMRSATMPPGAAADDVSGAMTAPLSGPSQIRDSGMWPSLNDPSVMVPSPALPDPSLPQPTRLPPEYQYFGVPQNTGDRLDPKYAAEMEQQRMRDEGVPPPPPGGLEAFLEGADRIASQFGRQVPRFAGAVERVKAGEATLGDVADIKFAFQLEGMQQGKLPSDLAGPEWEFIDYIEKQNKVGAHTPPQKQLDPKASKILAHMEQLRKDYKPTAGDATHFLPFNPIEAAELYDTYQSAERIEQGKGTDLDFRRVAQMMVRDELLAKRSLGQTVGDIVLEAPSFMGEFAATGGAYSGLKRLVQEGIEEGAERAVSSVAKSKLAGLVGQRVRDMAQSRAAGLVGRGATQTVATAAGLTGQTLANPQLVAESALRKMVGKYRFTTDEANDLEIILKRENDDFEKALPKGFLDAAIELGSERTGGAIAAGIDRVKFLKGLKAAVVARVLGKSDNPGAVLKTLRAGGFHGVFPEMFEERVGDVARGLTGVEENYGTTGKLASGDFKWSTEDPTLKQIAAEAIAFSIIGAPAGIMDAASNRGQQAPQATPQADPSQPANLGQPPATAPQSGPYTAPAPVAPPTTPPLSEGERIAARREYRTAEDALNSLATPEGARAFAAKHPAAARMLVEQPSRNKFQSTLGLPSADIARIMPQDVRDDIAFALRTALAEPQQAPAAGMAAETPPQTPIPGSVPPPAASGASSATEIPPVAPAAVQGPQQAPATPQSPTRETPSRLSLGKVIGTAETRTKKESIKSQTFEIHDSSGAVIGGLRVEKRGGNANFTWLGDSAGVDPEQMRALAQQYAEQNPDVKTLSGLGNAAQPPAAATPNPQGRIDTAFGDMGGAISQGLRDAYVESLQQKGRVPSPERNSVVGRFVQYGFDRGHTSPEEIERAMNTAADLEQQYSGEELRAKLGEAANQLFPQKQPATPTLPAPVALPANQQSQAPPESPAIIDQSLGEKFRDTKGQIDSGAFAFEVKKRVREAVEAGKEVLLHDKDVRKPIPLDAQMKDAHGQFWGSMPILFGDSRIEIRDKPGSATPPPRRGVSVTRVDVENTFKGTQVEDLADGAGWRVRFQNGRSLDVQIVDKIAVPNRERLEAKYGRNFTDEQWANLQKFGAKGSFRLQDEGLSLDAMGLIRLSSKRQADSKTLRHEAIHFAKAAGLFSEKEWGSLVERYSSPDRTSKQQEEDIATATRAWEEGKPLPAKIRKFARQTLESMGITPDADTVQALIETEGFWQRVTPTAASPATAEAPAPAKRRLDEVSDEELRATFSGQQADAASLQPSRSAQQDEAPGTGKETAAPAAPQEPTPRNRYPSNDGTNRTWGTEYHQGVRGVIGTDLVSYSDAWKKLTRSSSLPNAPAERANLAQELRDEYARMTLHTLGESRSLDHDIQATNLDTSRDSVTKRRLKTLGFKPGEGGFKIESVQRGDAGVLAAQKQREAPQASSAVEPTPDSEQATAAPPPQESATTKGDNRSEFADRVNAAARSSATGKFGPNKVFINHVWRQVQNEEPFRSMTLDEFKQRLTEENRKGSLALSRADLVEAMDPADVSESETQHLNANFHFVQIPQDRSAETTQAAPERPSETTADGPSYKQRRFQEARQELSDTGTTLVGDIRVTVEEASTGGFTYKVTQRGFSITKGAVVPGGGGWSRQGAIAKALEELRSEMGLPLESPATAETPTAPTISRTTPTAELREQRQTLASQDTPAARQTIEQIDRELKRRGLKTETGTAPKKKPARKRLDEASDAEIAATFAGDSKAAPKSKPAPERRAGPSRQQGFAGMEDATTDVRDRERVNGPAERELAEIGGQEFAEAHRPALHAVRQLLLKNPEIEDAEVYERIADVLPETEDHWQNDERMEVFDQAIDRARGIAQERAAKAPKPAPQTRTRRPVLSQETQDARAKAAETARRLAREWQNRPSMNPAFDPKLVSLAGELTVDVLRAGILTFRDYVRFVADTIGTDLTRDMGALLEQGWTRIRDTYDTEMDEAGSVAAILDEVSDEQRPDAERTGTEGSGRGRGSNSGSRGRGGASGGVGDRKGPRRSPQRQRQRDETDSPAGRPDSGPESAYGDDLPGPDHRIDPAELGKGGPKAKYRANIAAIKLLKALQAEGRHHATPAEQDVLARYVGWGMFPGVFNDLGSKAFDGLTDEQRAEQDPNKWAAERDEVKELLTAEEWQSAADSTINAHFTSPEIVQGMWEMAERLGFRGGRVLETSAGIGNFIGLQPAGLKGNSLWSAVELDKLTGAMLKYLYPSANVQVKGFQQYEAPDNFFDLIVSNVPFSDAVKILSDARYKAKKPNLHDYFFLKSIDKLRPGGLMMFITSTGTLDKQQDGIRRELAKKADLVAAVRLPEGAFEKNAGTAVVTDLIILQKRPEGGTPSGPAWTSLKTVPDPDGGAAIPINEYFADNPGQVLGTVDRKSRMYGKGSPHVSRTADFLERWERAVDSTPEDVYRQAEPPAATAREMILLEEGAEKEGQFVVRDGKLFRVTSGALVEADPVEPHPTHAPTTKRRENERKRQIEHVRDIAPVRDAIIARVNGMLRGDESAELDKHRKALRKAYDAFEKKHGPINSPQVRRSLSEDVDWPLLASLEVWDEEAGKVARLADIFDRETIRQRMRADVASSPEDAIALTLDESARLDIDRMAELLKTSTDELGRQLVTKGLAYEDPARGWVTADQYLSGNVRQKLRDAIAAAETDERFQANVDALRDVQPTDLLPEEIVVRPGSPWLPPETLKDFAANLLRVTPDHFEAQYVELTGEFVFRYSDKGEKSIARTAAVTEVWGTDRADFLDIMDSAMSGLPIVIRDTVTKADGSKTSVPNPEATEAAEAKVNAVLEEFQDWIWADTDRAQNLARLYNDKHNAVVNPRYDGSHLTFPGMLAPGNVLASTGKAFGGLRPHQKNAVWRTILRGKGLYAHEVGTGKTMTMVAGAMELKRLGLAHKPVIVVPDSRAEATAREAQDLYPAARILSASKGMNEKQRKATVAQIATGDWDLIILTHQNLGLLPVSAAIQEEYLNEQLAELTDLAIAEGVDPSDDKAMKKEGRTNRTVKRLRAAILKTREQIADLAAGKRDTGVTFEETGIDFLFVDEAHAFKSLQVRTRMGGVKGIPGEPSKMAQNLEMIATYLQRRHNGRGLVLATGTPITNSMAELYVMQRFIQRRELEEAGLLPFDAWASTFGQTISKYEFDHKGEFTVQTRFSQFINVQDLQLLALQDIDVVRVEDDPLLAQALNRPKRNDREEVIPGSVGQQEYLQSLGRRAEALKNRPPEPGGDNHLVIATDGIKSAMDMRLVASVPEDDDTKAKRIVANIVAIRQENPEATQMVFLEAGRSEATGFDLVADIIDKLVAAGIPKGKILNFRGASSEKKAKMAERLRTGDAWVAIGSTKTLGTGVNAQDHLRAIHHLEPAWTPEAIEQRNGRGWRQGNENTELDIITYLTSGTLDSWKWQTVARKDAFIRQFFAGGTISRTLEEEDEEDNYSNFERMQALSSGNPLLFERLNLQNDIAKLDRSRVRHERSRRRMQDEVRGLEKDLAREQGTLEAQINDASHYESVREDEFAFTTDDGRLVTDKKEAGEAIKRAFNRRRHVDGQWIPLGEYKGFDLKFRMSRFLNATDSHFRIARDATYPFNGQSLDTGSPENAFLSIDSMLRSIGRHMKQGTENTIERIQLSLDRLREDLKKPWRDADKLVKKQRRLERVEAELSDAPRQMTAEEEAMLEADRRQDEFEDRGTAGFLGGLGGKARPRAGKIPEAVQAPRPEIEKRLQQARGLDPRSSFQRAKDWVVQQWHRATRAQEHLPNDAEHAVANDFFRRLKDVGSTSADATLRSLAAITDLLNEEQLILFERHLVMTNLLASIDRGEPVQFGFRDREEAAEYLQGLDDLVQNTPDVKEALRIRRKVVREFVADLVEYGILPEPALDRAESYFHQQVLAHAQVQRAAGRGPQRKKRGFQRQRLKADEVSNAEGLLYNVDYLESEATWMTQARVELAKEKLIRMLARKYDHKKQFVEAAKARNFENLVGGAKNVARIAELRKLIAGERNKTDEKDAWIAELTKLDPTYEFRRKIATHASTVRDELKKKRVDLTGAPRKLLAAVDADALSDNGRWMEMVGWLASERGDTDAGKAARGILKAIGDRNRMMVERLKAKGFRLQTWEDIAKRREDLDIWQPEPGNMFYVANTVPEQIVERLQASIISDHKLTADQIRQVVAMAGPKREFVMPVEIVDQLRLLEKPAASSGINDVSAELVREWKIWTLLNPERFTAYKLRNFTGDLDVVLAGNPSLLKHLPRAVRELRRYYYGRLKLSPDLRRARDMGVVSSAMTAAEMPAIKDLDAFKRLYESRRQWKLGDAPKWYLDKARRFNEFTETIFRYAAYLDYLDQLKAGTLKHYGTSKPAVVQALNRDLGPEEAAAHLARNLLGDYSNLTVLGDWLRRHAFPFWSWNEINFKRYPRLITNAYEAGGVKRAALAGGVKSALIASRIGLLYAGVWLWNNLIMDDVEELLDQNTRSKLHFNIGITSDGKPIAFSNIGALGDFLEWFGVNTLLSLLPQYQDEQIGGETLLTETAKAPANKLVQGFRPDVRALFEIPAGQSLFPDAFNPRRVERDLLAANIFGLEDEWRAVKGIALEEGDRARPDYFTRIVFRVTDPRRNALNETYDLRSRFLEKKGRADTGRFPKGPFSKIREAAYADDYEAFKEARRAYLKDGKTFKNFEQSLASLDPIASRLNDEHEREFETEFLNDLQRRKLSVARDYAGELKVKLWGWWKAATIEEQGEAAFKAEASDKARLRLWDLTDDDEPKQRKGESDEHFARRVANRRESIAKASEYLDGVDLTFDEAKALMIEQWRIDRKRQGYTVKPDETPNERMKGPGGFWNKLSPFGERVKRLKEAFDGGAGEAKR